MTTGDGLCADARHSGVAALRLRFANTDGTSRAMEVMQQDPPWKVVRSFRAPAGESLVHLHNLSGGVLGGDHLHLDVDLQAGAHVQLTSTGATRIYRHRTGRPSSMSSNRFRINEGALLEYLPDQIIPYAGSKFQQETEIDMCSKDAGLFWWETITPGRAASGEAFQYQRLALRSTIRTDGKPIALDRFRLEPRRVSPQRSGALGRFTCLSTFYICKTGLNDRAWVELERLLMDEAEQSSGKQCIWGASRLVRHGVIVRGLGAEAAEMSHGLVRFWSLAKRFLYQREAVLPRKVY